MTWPDKSVTNELAHRLAYMVDHRVTRTDSVMKQTDESGRVLEVSHLCHNKSCVKSDHLVLESNATNISREKCSRIGTCTESHLPHCLL